MVGLQKRGGLRSTSHLGNNAADNGQRASSVSLKHALNWREPTNWLKPREPGPRTETHPKLVYSLELAASGQGVVGIRFGWSTNGGHV